MRVTSLVPGVEYATQQSEQALATALQQVSTGLRVNQPSDDPTASANMVLSLAESANLDQYTTNVSDVTARLQIADNAIAGITSSLNDAVTLAVSSPTEAVTDSNRTSIATQVAGILTTVISQANSTFQGEYVFGGSATGTPPFVNASTGYVSKNGSVSTPLTASSVLQTGSVTTVSDAGTGQTFSYTATAGATIGNLESAISAAVTAGTLSTGTTATINASGELAISSTAGIVASSNDSTLGSFNAAPGSSLANAYAYVGNSTVNNVQVGDSSTIAINVPGNQLLTTTNVIGSLTALINALKNGLSTQLASASDNINTAIGNLSQQRIPLDNTISQLSDQESYLSQETVTLTTHQTSLVGADLATSATNLAQAELDHSAVLAAASKVLQQNLLNYLAPG